MSFSLTTQLTDNATPALAALDAVLNPGQIAAQVGEAEVALFQKHFRDTGAITYQATNAGVTISVDQAGAGNRFALVEAGAAFGKKSNGTQDLTGGGVFSRLARSVQPEPDPSMLPADDEITAVAGKTIEALLDRATNGGAI